jgi:hypothetical protein
MAEIQRRAPLEVWDVARGYADFGYCFVDTYERGGLPYTKLTGLDVQDRASLQEMYIQGSAKADRNFGMFELRVMQRDGHSRVELRGIEAKDSEVALDIAHSCDE